MKKETIENILNFLKEKEGKELPISWKVFLAKENIIEYIIAKFENHPDDIQYKYDGNSNLGNRNIKKMPKDFYTDGDLNLSDSKQLTELPEKLYVGGFLNLTNCNQITKLPDNLYVNDWLDLENCKQITEFPKRLYVGGNLYIRNTPLANNYTDDEIIEMIDSKGGTLIGQIVR